MDERTLKEMQDSSMLAMANALASSPSSPEEYRHVESWRKGICELFEMGKSAEAARIIRIALSMCQGKPEKAGRPRLLAKQALKFSVDGIRACNQATIDPYAETADPSIWIG